MKVTAGLMLSRALTQFDDRVALTDEQGSQTYAELDAHTARIGRGLSSFGIGPGDRVGVLSHNRREVVHAWMAFERAAVVRVVLHSHFDFSAHMVLLTHVGAKAIVFDTRFAPELEAYRKQLNGLTFFAVGENPPEWAIPWEEVVAAGAEGPLWVDVDEDAPFAIQPTTGTTGAPKPWVATHRGWQTAIDQNLHYFDNFAPGTSPIGSDDVALHAHALQWASGWHLLYPVMMRGGRNVILDDQRYDPAKVLESLRVEHVTSMLLPAPMLTPILDLIEEHGGFVHRLSRLFLFFGAPDQLTRATRVLGPIWSNNYCSTEQGAITTRLNAHEAEARPDLLATVGRVAAPLIDLAIVDASGARVPIDKSGEVVVRSPVTNSRYWNMPEKTAESFLPGGWFRTGDVGHLDKDGYLTYSDRAVDAIHTAHGVVYPHVVEAAVLRHPAVANCGVVGNEDRVVVGVLLKDGFVDTPSLREEIVAVTSPGLAVHEIPEVVVCPSLPTVLGGAKVQRGVLRDQLLGEPK